MFKKLISAIFLLIIITLTSSCDSTNSDSDPKKIKTLLQGKTMGTTYHIAVVHSKDTVIDKKILHNNIDQLLVDLNKQVSTYIPSSQISLFNQTKNTNWIAVNKDFFEIVKASQNVSEISAGNFDISISPLVNLWGFGVKTHDKSPSEKQIQQAIAKIGYKQLELNSEQSSLRKLNAELHIDLSAIAKGFAVDKVSQLLSNRGLSNHLIEIGGELRVSGTNQSDKKWRIAVEQPDLTTTIAKHGLEITNRAVATSGDYRNYFVEKGIRRSHIIDPKTGYPIKHNLASVTVIHDSTMLADAYATALLVMGEKKGKLFAEENSLDVLMIIRSPNIESENGSEKFEFWSSSKLFK